MLSSLPSIAAGAVTAIAFTADGRRLVALDPAGAVQFWDLQTQQMTGGWQLPDPVPIDLACHPDGRCLVTLNPTGVVTTWDLATGRPLRRHAPPPGWRPERVALLRGGWVAGAGRNGAYFWNWESGQLIGPLQASDTSPGTMAVSYAGAGARPRVYEADSREKNDPEETREAGAETMTSKGNELTDAAEITPPEEAWNDSLLAALAPIAGVAPAGEDENDAPAGDGRRDGLGPAFPVEPVPRQRTRRQAHRETLPEDPGPGLDLPDSPHDGQRTRKQMTAPAPETDRPVAPTAHADQGGPVTGAGLSDSDETAKHSRVRRWPAPEWPGPDGGWAAHEGWLNGLVCADGGRTVISIGDDGFVRQWRLADAMPGPAAPGSPDGLTSLTLTPDEQVVVTGGEDGQLRRWSRETGHQLSAWPAHEGPVTALFSRGSRLYSAGEDAVIRTWLTDQASPGRTLAGHSRLVNCLVATPDGKRLLSGGNDGQVLIWDPERPRAQARFTGHEDWVFALQAAEKEPTAVSAGDDGLILIWDWRTGAVRRRLAGHSTWVRALALDEAAGVFYSAGYDGLVRRWRLSDGELLETWLLDEPLRCCTVASAGGIVLVGGESGRIWIVQPGPA